MFYTNPPFLLGKSTIPVDPSYDFKLICSSHIDLKPPPRSPDSNPPPFRNPGPAFGGGPVDRAAATLKPRRGVMWGKLGKNGGGRKWCSDRIPKDPGTVP